MQTRPDAPVSANQVLFLDGEFGVWNSMWFASILRLTVRCKSRRSRQVRSHTHSDRTPTALCMRTSRRVGFFASWQRVFPPGRSSEFQLRSTPQELSDHFLHRMMHFPLDKIEDSHYT